TTALATGATTAQEVGYLEAHGTGTPLGDPIEVGGLVGVFGDRPLPLVIGSLKANVGHMEHAAGIGGLIKTVLAMRDRVVPPQPRLGELNPHIKWADIPIVVSSTLGPWHLTPLVAGVSSFGFSGTNAHVILAETPVGAASLSSGSHDAAATCRPI